jgi:3'(2'), 5'-bisphosphate nucleotidase
MLLTRLHTAHHDSFAAAVCADPGHYTRKAGRRQTVCNPVYNAPRMGLGAKRGGGWSKAGCGWEQSGAGTRSNASQDHTCEFAFPLVQCRRREMIGKEGVWRLNTYLSHELEVALRLVRQAGAVIMDYYQTDLVVDHKAGEEPVTVADQAADALISAGLRAAFPDDGLLTEESEDDLSRLGKERVWIVDPLDGTTEFITETGEFAVQIALSIGGYPALGVVYQPVWGRLFFAVQGQGAYQVHDGATARLCVSVVSDPAQMCLVASRSHYSDFVESARQALGIESVKRVGSVGLKVGLVARAACDLYLATTVSKEWDLCAPHAVLLEAGGVLTNLCGESLVYNKRDTRACTGLICSNGLVHERIVETLAPLRHQVEG